MSLISQIDLQKCPQHVAIIMDGNGRWAKQQGKARLYGHLHGVEAVREVLKGAVELGVRYLTLYAFSTENWNRPKEEVDGLMTLMVETLSKEIKELGESNVRVRSMGDFKHLPKGCQEELNKAAESTNDNTKIDLILALNYSAKWEIVEATKKIAQKVAQNEFAPEDINEQIFADALDLNDVPNPDLLIRTSGEFRISNFMLWQIAYSELYFTDKLWPDFTKEDFFTAIMDYQNRERRFGKVSEQLK